jgi:hypothetical protein
MSGYLPDDLDATLLARPRVVFLHKPFPGSRLVEVLGDSLAAATAAPARGAAS